MSAAMKRLRAAVFRRADGKCEACRRHITEESGRLDHFFGRGAGRDGCTVETCWALCLMCDDAKTRNVPSSADWCDRFYVHAIEHGYHEVAQRAASRALWQAAKGM